jgi:hypothetical protein
MFSMMRRIGIVAAIGAAVLVVALVLVLGRRHDNHSALRQVRASLVYAKVTKIGETDSAIWRAEADGSRPVKLTDGTAPALCRLVRDAGERRQACTASTAHRR